MTPFTFTYKNSIFHKLDARIKVVIMCLLSVGVLRAMFPALAIISGLLILAMLNCGMHPVKSVSHIKYFLVLLIFVFLSRALTTAGDTFLSVYGIEVSTPGIKIGALVSIRFLIVMYLGMIFSFTTKPSSIKSAAEWFLRPIPFVPEKRAAIMIGLSIRFLPLIIEVSKQVSDAQKARLAENQRNPVIKISRLILPVLRKTFQTAERLATAMESRCFSEDRTEPEFIKSGNEFKAIVFSSLVFLVLVFL